MSDTGVPDWICDDCALLAGGSMPAGHQPTFHVGACGVCGDPRRWVTEPRDWRLLRLTLDDWRRVRLMVQQRKGGG